jgi:hypothetical protein
MIENCYLATHAHGVLRLAILLNYFIKAFILAFCLLFPFLLLFALFYHFIFVDAAYHFLFVDAAYLSHLFFSLVLVVSKVSVDILEIDFPV